MRIFTIIPLLTVPVIIYNVVAWGGATFSTVRAQMDSELLSISMASGANWSITPGHALIMLSLLLLFFELLKSTGFGRAFVYYLSGWIFNVQRLCHICVLFNYPDVPVRCDGRIYGDNCQRQAGFRGDREFRRLNLYNTKIATPLIWLCCFNRPIC